MSKKRRAGFIAIAALAILIVALIIVFALTKKPPVSGEKTITISIDHLVGEDRTLTISTGEEYLSGALEQENLIKGTQGAYGLFVTEVDGETADENAQQWWVFTKSGEYVETGVDSTVISDGDSYEFSVYEG